jgi:hypothetical protein
MGLNDIGVLERKFEEEFLSNVLFRFRFGAKGVPAPSSVRGAPEGLCCVCI